MASTQDEAHFVYSTIKGLLWYNLGMEPTISKELEQAVTAHPEGALKVQGANGTYWIMTSSAMEIRTAVQLGLDQADRGEVELWNSDEIKSAGRQLKQDRSKNA